MKITKRQLKRIIKEEKQKLLRESISDMSLYQDIYDSTAAQISDHFGQAMMKLFTEEPEAFVGRTTKVEWQEQVVHAQQELDTGIAEAIAERVEEIEMMLHDGQYSSRSGFGGPGGSR